MQLRDYLRIASRRRWLIALAMLATAGAAYTFSSRMPPTYEAKARIFIGPRAIMSGDLGSALEELTFSREFIASYAELLRSRPLAERVVDKEDLPFSPAELTGRVTTKIIADTRIIEVAVTDSQAHRARRTANALVETFVEEGVEQLGGAGGARAKVLEPALLPGRPVSPKPVRDGLIGAALGLALGVGTAFLLETLDSTLRSREDVEAALAPLPVLAAVPGLKRRRRRRLVFDKDPRSPAAEAFRTLRTNVRFSANGKPIRRVLVTSPYADDGKTMVAANLAASFAMGGFDTVLVESDLRRPLAHDYLRASTSPGIAEVATERSGILDALHQSQVPNLSVLPAGGVVPNPSELLGSDRMAGVLQDCESRADVLVLDTPPALAVTDAIVLAPHVDGVVLVIRAGRTRPEWAQEARATFERIGVRVIGVVLNDADLGDSYYYRHYYRRYTERRGRDGRRIRRRARGKHAYSFEFEPSRPERPAESPANRHE